MLPNSINKEVQYFILTDVDVDETAYGITVEELYKIVRTDGIFVTVVETHHSLPSALNHLNELTGIDC